MIWDFIMGAIPAWVWPVVAAALVLIVVGVLKGDGWKWAFGIIGAAALMFLQSRARQRGAAIERAKQDAADEQAEDIITANRNEVQAMPRTQRDEEFEEWEKD